MKKLIVTILVLASFAFQAGAQIFGYNVDFDYLFNNGEMKTGNAGEVVFPSYTLHTVKLTPSVILNLPAKESFNHKLALGIDIFKQMGEGNDNWQLFKEITLNYSASYKFLNGGTFSGIAGCFSRKFSEIKYPYFMNSLDNVYLDRNYEGIFFKYKTDRLYVDLGLDWMGLIGDKEHPERRERFQVISSGKWNFAGGFNFSWFGRYYHFAWSPAQPKSVVDNHTLYPFFGYEYKGLELGIGPALTYQRDREVEKTVHTPMGLFFFQAFEKWGAGIRNEFYYGDDLMPFYEKFGSELYFGRTGYHTLLDYASVYDNIDIYYAPKIVDNLTLRVDFEFHLGSPNPAYEIPVFRGWEQRITVAYNFGTGSFKKKK